MKNGFEEKKGKIIVEELVRMIHENRAYLSEIDGAIGDGDHGINMDKGFNIAGARLKDKDVGFSEALKILGNVLVDEIGGSMGPLYGMFFKRLAKGCMGKETINAENLEDMLQRACDGIGIIGDAKIGDKTMLDTLIPAFEAYKDSCEKGNSFSDALDAMVVGAKNGWESTKDMVAKVGRASRLGERSRGVLDAGATSCYLILKTLAEEIKKLSL